MFLYFLKGTFQAERKDEKVVYGLVDPINTFDTNLIQVDFSCFHVLDLKHFLKDILC